MKITSKHLFCIGVLPIMLSTIGCSKGSDKEAIKAIETWCHGQIAYEFEREAPNDLEFSTFCTCMASEWESKLNSEQKALLVKYSDEWSRNVLEDEKIMIKFDEMYEFGPEAAKVCGWNVGG